MANNISGNDCKNQNQHSIITEVKIIRVYGGQNRETKKQIQNSMSSSKRINECQQFVSLKIGTLLYFYAFLCFKTYKIKISIKILLKLKHDKIL